MSDSGKDQDAKEYHADVPLYVRFVIYPVFAWIIIGICYIYGVRLWYNSSVGSASLPITGAAFCVAISFTIVLCFQIFSGRIKLTSSILGNTIGYDGASGPIILWCFCFVILCLGLYLLGFDDAVKLNTPPDSKSIYDLWNKSYATFGWILLALAVSAVLPLIYRLAKFLVPLLAKAPLQRRS